MNPSELKPQLQAAILGLKNLLETTEVKEPQFQQFFESNPIIFTILGYTRSIPFTKQTGRSLPRDEFNGLKPEPDFLVQRQNGLWEVFEIKTPVSKNLLVTSNIYRERFTAEVVSYIAQTITYEKYFTRNPVNRKKVKDAYDIDIQEDLDIKIVIGRDHAIDTAKIHEKCRDFRHRVDIVTFDEILGRLKQEYELAFGIFENLPGFSFYSLVRFRSPDTVGPKYFLDIGRDPHKNRVSFFLRENSEVVFTLFDASGLPYELSIPGGAMELVDHWRYLLCEFGYSKDRFVMSASIDGDENDFRRKDQQVDIDLSLHNMVLGTDVSHVYFGCFDVAEHRVFDHTLTLKERYQLLGYFTSKYQGLKEVPQYASFDGSKFMIRDHSGHFTQPEKRFRPIYRDELQD